MAGRYALVIGNSEYDDKTLSQLKTPEADVHTLATALRDPQLGGFDSVQEMINQSEASVRRAISTFFTQKKSDDLLLLYFSGHGVLDAQGRLFLAAKDTQRELLNATGIPAAFITDDMDSCRSKRQILILDCCHSGAFARGTKGDAPAMTQATFEGNGFGRVVLTASDSTQYALEGDQVIEQASLSLFTHYLLEGLTSGEADSAQDGWLTLDEWYDYAYDRVVSETPDQTPRKWVYNQQGELIVARNPNPVKPPSGELPEELKLAVGSPFVGVRADAVAELKRLLLGSNPAMTQAAYLALQGMAANDDSLRLRGTAGLIIAEYDHAHPSAPVEAEGIAAQEGLPSSFYEADTQTLQKADLEKARAERLAAENAEAERQAQLAREKAEAERLAAEKAEAERQAQLAREKAEAERLAAEKAEQKRLARLAREKAEAERLAAEKAEQERLARLAREKAEMEQQERELAEAARLAVEKVEQERQAAKAEQERQEKVNAEQARQAAEKAEAERQSRLAREKAEMERQLQAQAEAKRFTLQQTEAMGLAQGDVLPQEQHKRKPFLPPLSRLSTRNVAVFSALAGVALCLVSVAVVWNLINSGLNKMDEVLLTSAAEVTLTPDATEVAVFQETPTPPPGETPTIFPTDALNVTPVPVIPLLSPSVDTNCRSGPSMSYNPPLSVLQVGQSAEVHGRNPDSSWWYIQDPNNPGLFCWISAQTTTVDGDTSALQVVEPPPLVEGQEERIVFASNRDGNWEIYLWTEDGKSQVRLTNDPGEDSFPVWSPDGTRIAFHSDRAGNFDIYVMNADGSGLTRLTDDARADTFPAWSPDGTRIAFQSKRDVNKEIYVMDADGSNEVRLTHNDVDDLTPSWSPDSSQIVYSSVQGGGIQVFVMNADGSNPDQLTSGTDLYNFPVLSPVGLSIVWVNSTPGIEGLVLTLEAEGWEPKKLLTGGGWDPTHPRWSSDGKYIYFTSQREGNSNIYRMDADGSNIEQLTDNPAEDAAPSGYIPLPVLIIPVDG